MKRCSTFTSSSAYEAILPRSSRARAHSVSAMEDGHRAEEPAVSRGELYGDYGDYYRQPGAEVRPCRDPSLLRRSARYLLAEPEPAEAFTVFPVHRALRQHRAAHDTYGRKHLHAFTKATELLEIICVNLFLQPWKKEIKTLKTFTGPFIYDLQPVLNSSTIQAVLGSIGYLLHTDTAQSEYRLSEDANPDKAKLLGFELLLARVECDHLLELLEKDQLEPQDFLEVLQRRMGSTKLDEPTEKKTTTTGQKEEENKKMEEANGKEVPLLLDPTPAVKPEPKPRRRRSVDPSIIEMQKTYPDLAFRGRPLLSDKPQRANGSSSKDVHATNADEDGGDSNAAEVPKVEGVHKGPKAAATTARGKVEDAFGDDCRGGGCHDRSSGGSAAGDAGSGHVSTTDGSRGDDLQTNRAANPTLPSVSLTDEQELRELAERMCPVQETKKEVKRKEENKTEEANKERSQTEREAEEEENLGKPARTGPVPSRAAGRCTRSAQSDPAGAEEQKEQSPAVSTADCQSCRGGDGTEQQEAEDAGRAEPGREEEEEEEEQLSFVIVDRN